MQALAEGFLSHLDRGVFPGGCFFASATAEMDTRPGRVRDRVVGFRSDWVELIEDGLRTAKERGDLGPSADPAQLAFEVNALLGEANGLYLASGDRGAFERARRGIADRLERAAASAQAAPSAQA